MYVRGKQKTIDANDSLIGEIVEYERKYINEKQLLEIRNRYIRKTH